jgi:hypothetical protein
MTVWDSLHSLLDYECLLSAWLTWFWFKNQSLLQLLLFADYHSTAENWTLSRPSDECPQRRLTKALLFSVKSKSKSKSKLYYDRRSAGQSLLEQSTLLGLTTRSWLLSDSCGFVGLGRPLWREDGSAVCNCYCPSLAQSFSGPSPIGLVALFYRLRFETSLFIASYDSQGHGGGIRPRLHTLTFLAFARVPLL